MIQVLPSWRWGSSDARRPIHLRSFRLRWWAHQQCWKLSKWKSWFKCASGIEFEFTCIQHPTAVPGRCCQRSSCSWPGRNRKDEPTCTKRPACTRAESCASPRRLIESTNSVDFNWKKRVTFDSLPDPPWPRWLSWLSTKTKARSERAMPHP